MTENLKRLAMLYHIQHINLVRGAHPAEVQALPKPLCVLLFLMGDIGVGLLRVEGGFGWELLFINLLEAVHILVLVPPLAYVQTDLLHLVHGKFL